MRFVIQRVSEASVKIAGTIYSEIQHGFLVLVGIEESDSKEDADWLCNKLISLRIFSDADDKMNLSLQEIHGDVLLVSQFTLFASTKKGNRPSFIRSAKPEQAVPLYEYCITQLSGLLNKPVRTGQFGADMKVSLVNDGPVTILIDSKNRE
ncbi:MAG: D-tyrosyl-tRNA(Tyr) deacylase [Bacteroidetes bacterium]|jgi:D-tyrosyl-tRNA(Tyr) deacylase|nr:D-tyrosyl-tRNA(Tyr) deacylase [Bacteroidota bacterium]